MKGRSNCKCVETIQIKDKFESQEYQDDQKIGKTKRRVNKRKYIAKDPIIMLAEDDT